MRASIADVEQDQRNLFKNMVELMINLDQVQNMVKIKKIYVVEVYMLFT